MCRRVKKTYLYQGNPEMLGKTAETTFRNRETGRRRNLKEEQREKRHEEARKAELAEKYLEWGTG